MPAEVPMLPGREVTKLLAALGRSARGCPWGWEYCCC